MFGFNPYEGKTYREIYKIKNVPSIISSNILEDANSTVVSNPGFAPVYDSSFPGRNPNINGYACVVGFFNENYLETKSSDGKPYKRRFHSFVHEGIDLRGIEGTEIVSFIYGNVIMYGTYRTYGRTIFISTKDNTGIYLLAHLSEFNKKVLDTGSVMPGDVVGKVGRTSSVKKRKGTDGKEIYSFDLFEGAHLHTSYFRIDGNRNTVNNFVKTIGNNSFGKIIEHGDAFRKGELRNPFNHDSKKTKNIYKSDKEIEEWDKQNL